MTSFVCALIHIIALISSYCFLLLSVSPLYENATTSLFNDLLFLVLFLLSVVSIWYYFPKD